jgi:hypothetical protein
LNRVEYGYSVKQVKAGEGDLVRLPALALGALRLLQSPLGPDLTALAFAGLAQVDKAPSQVAQGQVALGTFTRRWQAATQPLREHPLDRDVAREVREQSPDFEAFDLERHLHNLRATDERAVQPHYDLQVWLRATDNNADTGPVSRESERFRFRIVSENELLVEVGKEEEGLHDKLEKAVNDLRENRENALEKIVRDLPALKPAEFGLMALRVKEVEDVVARGEEKAAEVLRDYRRVLYEMRANRVNRAMILKVEKICNTLETILDPTRGEMSLAKDALADLHKPLEAAALPGVDKSGLAVKRVDQLLAAFGHVLDEMGEMITINKVIQQIVEIAKAEQNEYERLKALKDRMETKIIEDALGPDVVPKK